LIGAAATSAAAAAVSESNASGSAASAEAFAVRNNWVYDDDVNMADPGTGNVRLNNSTPSIATAIAISDLSSNDTNPDLSDWIATWSSGSGSNRGTIDLIKDESNFIKFSINDASVDNTGWYQLSVSPLSSSGTITDADELAIGAVVNGTSTITGGITALTGQVTASGSGSVVATLSSSVQDTILDGAQPVFIESPADKDYRLLVNIPFGFTISDITTRSASGTCTATFKINTTALGGTANSVSSSEQTQAHASANVLVAGDDLVMTISSNSACADMSVMIKYRKSF
jgi:hypothetical protein